MNRERQRMDVNVPPPVRWVALAAVFLVLPTVLSGAGGLAPAAPSGHPGTSLARPATNSTGCSSPLPEVGGICLWQVGNAPDSFLMVDGSYNFSFGINDVAEVTPSGAVVAAASLILSYFSPATVQHSAQFVNISVTDRFNVTNASGSWLPNDVPPIATGGAPLTLGTLVLGQTTLSVVYHLQNVSSGATRVKFDVDVQGWPWVSSGDELAFAVNTFAPAGAHVLYSPSNTTVEQNWDASNATLASLTFGPSATVSSPGQASTSVDVGVQFALNPLAHPPSHDANVLVTFEGTGGFATLSYDPWVIFGPSPTVLPPGGGTGPSGPAPWVWTGGAAILVAAAVLAVVAIRSHRRPMEADLSPVGGSRPVPSGRSAACSSSKA